MAEREITLRADGETIAATLGIPPASRGLIIFAHGSGSSRHSPRNRFVARVLQQRGMATMLLDLLTQREEEIDRVTATLRFDIALLARRIELAREWCAEQAQLSALPIGYFGASTGAAAALLAAAGRDDIYAIVSRGGRPDLAGPALAEVCAPTLLIVGERDHTVIELNRRAASQISAPCEISIVPGAGHLFEEPGALEQVARIAQEWFARYLTAKAT
jgi:putative phosphoribosyl transferase